VDDEQHREADVEEDGVRSRHATEREHLAALRPGTVVGGSGT
jgi:hypothetical protein